MSGFSDFVDESGVTRLRARAPRGGGALAVVRVPITFDTPGLTAPGAGLTLYQPTDGDLYIGSWVSIPATVWDGATPVLNTGPLGDLGHYIAALDLTGTDAQTGSGDTTTPRKSEGGTDLWGTAELLHADPIIGRIDDGAGGNPGAAQGVGEIVLVLIPA